MTTLRSTPLDAPLYQMDSERGIEYWGCRAVMAAFTVTDRAIDLVPRGLHLGDPTLGSVLVAVPVFVGCSRKATPAAPSGPVTTSMSPGHAPARPGTRTLRPSAVTETTTRSAAVVSPPITVAPVSASPS